MPESKPFHEQHTKRECYYFKVSVFAIRTALCKQWDFLLPWVNQMFQKKKKKNPNLPTVTAEKKFFHQIDWLTFLSLVEQVCFSPFYFFWLICTFQTERHKSVFHSHVLVAKSLNARLYLLLCLPPLSPTETVLVLLRCWIWDKIDCSFLVFF